MYNVIDYAYAGLLHDIGKFYQRTEMKSSLTKQEEECTPIHRTLGYHTHLHSGYTSRFFIKYLNLNNDLEYCSSAHHKDDLNPFLIAIQKADRIASGLDRSDETHDSEEEIIKSRCRHIISRLNSIFYEIDFGNQRDLNYFPLSSIDRINYPVIGRSDLSKEDAVNEYRILFDRMVEDINKNNYLLGDPTPFKYHRMYSILYKYTTLIPASSYETNFPSVSLFDHLKITSAIASCIGISNNHKKFYMFEFDMSGIQNYIYKVVEGSSTKRYIAKSLRGRSILISLLTSAISYSILNEFSLTEANIIYDTGGGGLILLPYRDDVSSRIQKICENIQKEMFRLFDISLSFVYALEEISANELEEFKSNKAINLKTKLEQAKSNKYSFLYNDSMSYEQLGEKDVTCLMCGEKETLSNGLCQLCNDILFISDYYTKHDKFFIRYSFNELSAADINLGFVGISFLDSEDNYELINKKEMFYIDSINNYECGNVKLIANLVPKENNEILNFEAITKLVPKSCGDRKLGVLKMDIDNLGAMFAFGMKQKIDDNPELQRSLSKYLTLSRMVEIFFGQRLKEICVKVTKEINAFEDNMFYINYASGDDLVILGPVYGIIKLANEINKEFNYYVNNENITISAGIYIQNEKKPIRFGIQYAESYLGQSKNYSSKGKIVKNAITIMDTTLNFTDYNQLIEIVEKYRGYIKEKKISRTSFYALMNYLQVETLDQYFEIIPKIQYMLIRSNMEENIRIEFSKEITQIRSIKELPKVVLMMKLVILLTREEN